MPAVLTPFVASLDALPDNCFACFKVNSRAFGIGYTQSLETATVALANGVSVTCLTKHRVRGWE